jgi:hypothetical protein
MPSPEWTVDATCPHGYKTKLAFDALGYLLKPKDNACGEHRPVKVTETPTPFQIWRETRRARKALRKRPPWLSS